ncbi:MAG: 16S rRNA (cytosine(1402)-N(4))-methyltransferase [Candidatus Nealsonbacteria bacterium RIFCSPLOWO2_12_FULL_39_31]|uniref:Ribosomal RNA small subunit methyltransferase H n=3 Tax=Candidatus Nealsoniibacteriota TaxID=1817911 RepID=A0A1G2EGM6_9BACT|nr:MAG: Ribosomal RNA small subunit methyltransferase H [Parcubacteria group bacterium GW2011_GWA2_38_27]KKQ96185.1 MAG: Ribosomal RNA small subunit methyltransferase H [Parcubacteria group bacterium GW2011_GWC2_39_11]OGZ19394.1 MAG: 16S rRNA (cytosine(1402)-N(4))-methyltransferase [Candidatus Nealsonbacteria bacterium RIFCSPHIGHO2_01_FULL_38_55]OGZ21589.1 MAG: 16S rRNA (cytosine(1402)-N(4))-methyltransferase [Candidatus Nealsonbacteria bacterium RIFCSPHIGHO2_02_FULL_38_75]OGZ21708.1 MAG: 16S r
MHIAVLLKETLQYLDPKPDENFIDCTAGEGGHTFAILEKISPKGKVLGIDWDAEMIKKINRQERLVLINDSYANLKKITNENKFYPVNGILLDLGMSSWHLDESGRGFSFLKDEPLEMRYKSQISSLKSKNYLTARYIINNWRGEEIERILREYGEERFSGQIAKKIIENRKIKSIETTFQLVNIIREAIPARFKSGKIHFATRTFQALRMATNSECDNLKTILPQVLDILEPGGRIVVISFHSIEDRVVKDFFKEESRNNHLNIITKKPIIPSEEEIKSNHRSRSAKLRSAVKI